MVLVAAFVFLLVISALGGRVSYLFYLALVVIAFGAAAVASQRNR